jgi:hypothetical protein
MAKKFLDYDGLDEVVTQIKSLLLDKQDTLSSANAGDNITIETINNVLKISADAGIQEITSPTQFWTLGDGVYHTSTGSNIILTTTNETIPSNQSVIINITSDNSTPVLKYYFAIGGYKGFVPQNTIYYGASSGDDATDIHESFSLRTLLTTSKVVNNLTSTSTTEPLSAAQGKALNESKQATITGAATTITSSNLTASRALVSDSNGKVAVSDVTSTEIGYLDGVTSAIQTQLNGKQATLTTAQQNAVDSGITGTLVGKITTNETAISTINSKIPNEASSTNQLADKDFVNSSIQTQTAHFRGNWATWSAVPTSASSYPADDDGNTTPTSNDYMVVQDASGYTGETLVGTWRFKYSGVWSTNGKNGWLPEYQVNETPLTAAQLAAINSGITSTLVGQITTNQTNIGNKVDKSSTASQVYITNSSGTSTTASQGTAFNKSFETSTTNIKMDGTVSVGSSSNVARADHVHPTDTTRQATYTASSSAWDTTPTASSTKPVTSGGIYTALAGKEDTMTAITTQEIDDLFNGS